MILEVNMHVYMYILPCSKLVEELVGIGENGMGMTERKKTCHGIRPHIYHHSDECHMNRGKRRGNFAYYHPWVHNA